MADGAGPSTSRSQPRSAGDRELARVLALLEDADSDWVTLTVMRERGVRAPAQAIYTLELAGYPIDRSSCTGPPGQRAPGYRIRGGRDPAYDSPDLAD